MKDVNGIEMVTGMIVEIRNAYFQNDNGLWVNYRPLNEIGDSFSVAASV